MKRTLVLVKHSEPVLEPVLEPRLAPNRWRLSESGLSGSVLLGERLAWYEPGDRLFRVSGAARARPGGYAVPGRRGVWAARNFFERPDELVWGNETAEGAGGRFEGAVRRVLDERKEGVVVIVAHRTVISLLVARYNDLDAFGFWQKLGLPSFCVLSAEELRLRETIPKLKA